MKNVMTNVQNLFRLTLQKGNTTHLTIDSCFSGTVKVLQSHHNNKWLVEIIDVCMCYPDKQVQLQQGEQVWVYKDDIYREKRNIFKRRTVYGKF